jgi:hypothetical protein
MNFVRIKSLSLAHPAHGPALNIVFNEGGTYIQGSPGSGLSTLAKALFNEAGVESSGNGALLQRFQRLILYDESAMFRFEGSEFLDPLSPELCSEISRVAWQLYEELTRSTGPANWGRVAFGSSSERECAALSKSIAIRKIMKFDLPFVFDAAPSFEPKHFEGVRRVLARQAFQLIAFGYHKVHPIFGAADFELPIRSKL